MFVDDSATDPRMIYRVRHRFGPSMMLPLRAEGRLVGTLALPRRRGDRPYTGVEKLLATRFASQAALALVLADARRGRAAAVYEDRDRIARDLHHLVVQRLFATGMTLEAILRLADVGDVRDLLMRAVEELRSTVQEVRTAIFALRQPPATGRRFCPLGPAGDGDGRRPPRLPRRPPGSPGPSTASSPTRRRTPAHGVAPGAGRGGPAATGRHASGGDRGGGRGTSGSPSGTTTPAARPCGGSPRCDAPARPGRPYGGVTWVPHSLAVRSGPPLTPLTPLRPRTSTAPSYRPGRCAPGPGRRRG
ncbi:hypothetical protein SFUMM280S_08122 [Streptomyces fumanus]